LLTLATADISAPQRALWMLANSSLI